MADFGTPRDRSGICAPPLFPLYYTKVGGGTVAFDFNKFVTLTLASTPVSNPGVGSAAGNALVRTYYPWWQPESDFNTSAVLAPNPNVIGDFVPPDKIADEIINVFSGGIIDLVYAYDTETYFGSLRGGVANNYTSTTTYHNVQTALTDEAVWNNGIALGSGIEVGVPDSEEFRLLPYQFPLHGPNQVSTFQPYSGGSFGFQGPDSGNFTVTKNSNLRLLSATAYITYDILLYSCGKGKRKPCVHPCGGCGSVPLKGCSTFCVIDGALGYDPLGTWSISGPDGVVATNSKPNGWSVTYHQDCTITVCAPCIEGPGGNVTYYVSYQDVDQATVGNCFTIQPIADCGNHTPSAIEIDTVRRWLHVGQNDSVLTYNAYDLSKEIAKLNCGGVIRMRCDTRQAALAILAGDGILISRDGGSTATGIGDPVAAGSSLIERDSERGWLLWFNSDASQNVTVQRSEDWESFNAPVKCTLDNKPLQGMLLDSCQDPRAGGRISMVITLMSGPTKVIFSDDAGETFTST